MVTCFEPVTEVEHVALSVSIIMTIEELVISYHCKVDAFTYITYTILGKRYSFENLGMTDLMFTH